MLDSRNLVSGNNKYLFGFTLLLLVATICLAFSNNNEDDFDISRREILLRRIGHDILLQSGDSKSRILPLKKISENEYQIRFENDFTFQPDSLVNITKHFLGKEPYASNYIVNVLNCGDESVAYGYVISENKKDNIISCRGRIQPRACYKINIKFKPTGINIAKNKYILGSVPILMFVGFTFLIYRRRKSLSKRNYDETYQLGSILFDAKHRKLIINEQTIDMTATETRVLLIFALSPNQIIERSRLQKEIWEDEGVIVGRSLDMFISKLRKKLEVDSNIKIVVIRGKGYRLEIRA